MNEPVTIELNGRDYIHWGWRVWTDDGSGHPNKLRQRVKDWALVTQLEKALSDQQRRQQVKPNPTADLRTGQDIDIPARRVFQTKREWKGEAK